MLNKYPGICSICGDVVQVKKGLILKQKKIPGWTLKHIECAEQEHKEIKKAMRKFISNSRKELKFKRLRS